MCRVTGDATFQAGDGDLCLDGTRVDILRRVVAWLDTNSTTMLWIHGLPGAGKSAISRTIVSILKKRWSLGSDFFFSRDDAERRTPLALWCHILYDLSCQHSAFRTAVLAKLQAPDFKLGSAQPGELVDIIVNTVQAIHNEATAHGPPLVVVIDALDECPQLSSSVSKQRKEVLAGLSKLYALRSTWFRVIVTSRAESDICAFLDIEDVTSIELLAGKAVSSQSSDDIKCYLDYYLVQELPGTQATPRIIQNLVEKAAGLFIWAKTAVEFVRSPQGLPHKRLQTLQQVGFEAGGIYTLYHLVLTEQFGKIVDPELARHFQRVVGALLSAATPLTQEQLEGLVSLAVSGDELEGTDKATVSNILRRLSTVTIHQSLESHSSSTIQFAHLSFAEFLQDQSNIGKFYGINPKNAHTDMLLQCLLVMNTHLMFNICRLPSSHYSNSHYDLPSLISHYISLHLQYAAQHWTHHLINAPNDYASPIHLDTFLRQKLLFWFEVMSLLNMFSLVVSSLRDCAKFLQVSILTLHIMQFLMKYCHSIHQTRHLLLMHSNLHHTLSFPYPLVHHTSIFQHYQQLQYHHL